MHGSGDTPSRQRIFTCHPQTPRTSRLREADSFDAGAPGLPAAGDGRGCRRRCMPFYDEGRKERDFDLGIQTALERLLVSPQFLFRIETRSGRRGARNASIASAIWSWPRACRSSCGAAFRTTSC